MTPSVPDPVRRRAERHADQPVPGGVYHSTVTDVTGRAGGRELTFESGSMCNRSYLIGALRAAAILVVLLTALAVLVLF
jgi:hypothetical protein